MANTVDLLHINDIAILCNLGPDDNLADWKTTRFLARVLVDGELLDETDEHLPVIREGAKTIARWELGGLQVPTVCLPLSLVITTTGGYELFRFKVEQRPDRTWWFEDTNTEAIRRNFRAQVTLRHPSSHFQKRYVATFNGALSLNVPLPQPWEEKITFPHWLLESLSAEMLVNVGKGYYGWFLCGDNAYLKLTLATLERALDKPDIDPGLSQVLETIIPFLYCLDQGDDSCPDIALEVLRTFPGLKNAQVEAQLLLHQVVYDVVNSFQWLDYAPLAIELITGPLAVLLHSVPLDQRPLYKLHLWVTLADFLIPTAKEVLPLVDLVVDLQPGVCLTSLGSQSLALLRAGIYLKQAVLPGGPSLEATLCAAEFAMHSSKDSQGLNFELEAERQFTQWFSNWIVACLSGRRSEGFDELEPYTDRLLSFIAWQLSNLRLPPRNQNTLRLIRSKLTDNASHSWGLINASMPQPAILNDNDNEFIRKSYSDLLLDRVSRKEMPARYPKGAVEMVETFITTVIDPKMGPMAYALAATTARALHLPATFRAYELFMVSLEPLSQGAMLLCSDQLKGMSGFPLVVRDAISYASEMGNLSLALQWSDQGRSKIWDWLVHSHSSINQIHTTEPIIAGKLRTRPRWMDNLTSTQLDDSIPANNDGGEREFSWMVDNFMLLPGFDRFLQPKTPAEIVSIAEALGGPIIYLNCNRHSSHALAVLPGLDDVVHIPLPHIDYAVLRNLSVEFMESPRTFLRQESPMGRMGFAVKPRPVSQPPLRFPAKILLEQLWNAIVEPVLTGLGIQRAQTKTADMPRIWWCPSGPLSALPLHAAGIYQDDGQGPVISDYVVSSYFPSASALAFATRPEDPSQKFSLLTIANPTGASLPGTEWELEIIKKHATTKELVREEVTVEAVKKGMEEASW
ncbi:hypothetical protein BDN72DRAFT_904247, partial [Pluteus cervinus]